MNKNENEKLFAPHIIAFTEPFAVSVHLEEEESFGARSCQATITKPVLSPHHHQLVLGQIQTYVLIKCFTSEDLKFCWTGCSGRTGSFGLAGRFSQSLFTQPHRLLLGAGYSHWELPPCAPAAVAVISSLGGREQTAVIYTSTDLRF